MFNRYVTDVRSLMAVAIASALAVPLIPFVALPISAATDTLIQKLFWSYSVSEETISVIVDVRMYVVWTLAVALLIASVVCGFLSFRSLYRKYRLNESSEWPLIVTTTCVGFVLLLTFIAYIYIPLTITW